MGWAIDQHYHITGILVDVHSVHLWNTEALQPQFPPSEPMRPMSVRFLPGCAPAPP
jgi:hypothetical protein